IDGFQQIRDPIYGGLTFAIQGQLPRWYVQNVGMWVGQRAYIEVLDDGDGHVELERVLFSDNPSPAPEAPAAALIGLMERAGSAEGLAQEYQKLLLEAVAAWRDGKSGRDRESLDLLDAIFASEVVAALPCSKADNKDVADKLRQAKALEASIPVPRRGLAM